jgi:hypothetical protein
MRYIILVAMLLLPIIANDIVDTSQMVVSKETHFQKHIEFWTILISLVIFGFFHLYKNKIKK